MVRPKTSKNLPPQTLCKTRFDFVAFWASALRPDIRTKRRIGDIGLFAAIRRGCKRCLAHFCSPMTGVQDKIADHVLCTNGSYQALSYHIVSIANQSRRTKTVNTPPTYFTTSYKLGKRMCAALPPHFEHVSEVGLFRQALHRLILVLKFAPLRVYPKYFLTVSRPSLRGNALAGKGSKPTSDATQHPVIRWHRQRRVVVVGGHGGSEDQSWKHQTYRPFVRFARLGTRVASSGRGCASTLTVKGVWLVQIP